MSRTRHARPRKRPDRAEVQRFRTIVVGHMTSRERAALPCGCAIYVGRLVDDQGEATTGARPCGERHEVLIERAKQLLLEALATPRRRLLVDACAEVLSSAAREQL